MGKGVNCLLLARTWFRKGVEIVECLVAEVSRSDSTRLEAWHRRPGDSSLPLCVSRELPAQDTILSRQNIACSNRLYFQWKETRRIASYNRGIWNCHRVFPNDVLWVSLPLLHSPRSAVPRIAGNFARHTRMRLILSIVLKRNIWLCTE